MWNLSLNNTLSITAIYNYFCSYVFRIFGKMPFSVWCQWDLKRRSTKLSCSANVVVYTLVITNNFDRNTCSERNISCSKLVSLLVMSSASIKAKIQWLWYFCIVSLIKDSCLNRILLLIKQTGLPFKESFLWTWIYFQRLLLSFFSQ